MVLRDYGICNDSVVILKQTFNEDNTFNILDEICKLFNKPLIHQSRTVGFEDHYLEDAGLLDSKKRRGTPKSKVGPAMYSTGKQHSKVPKEYENDPELYYAIQESLGLTNTNEVEETSGHYVHPSNDNYNDWMEDEAAIDMAGFSRLGGNTHQKQRTPSTGNYFLLLNNSNS